MEEDKVELYQSPLKIWAKRSVVLLVLSAITFLIVISFWRDSRASYQTIAECRNANLHSIKSGPCVKSLQDTLNVKHRACESKLTLLSVNGNFDDATKKAISEYQLANSIEPTGDVDSKTIESLISSDNICLASSVSPLGDGETNIGQQQTNTAASVIDVKGWKKIASTEIDLSTSNMGVAVSMCRMADYKIKVKGSIDSTNMPKGYSFSVGAVDKDDNIIVETPQIGAESVANIESSVSQSQVDKNLNIKGSVYVSDSSTETVVSTSGILVSELYVCG